MYISVSHITKLKRMKILYIVRHAKSSWKSYELEDIDRPLNNRGKRNAPEMGLRLANKGIRPDILISSPAKRAYSTAKKIAKMIQYPKNRIIIENKLYHGMEEDIIEVISNTPDEYNELMIFGHNPGFTDLANSLSGAQIYNIPTCGIVAISFDTDNWQNIDTTPGKLIFFDYPKKSS